MTRLFCNKIMSNVISLGPSVDFKVINHFLLVVASPDIYKRVPGPKDMNDEHFEKINIKTGISR